MYPRLIKSAAVLAAVSLCAAAASLYWVYRSGHAHLIGSLVFAETVRPESKIKEIVIRSPGYTATLENDNDFWHIREADNYYANFDLVRSLFKNFRETRFIRKQTATPQLLSELDLGNPYRSDAHAGTSISILDEQGRELNHLILGKAGAENQTRFARIPSLPDIFTVSGQYTLPTELSSWIQQPLMSLELKDLQAVQIDGEKVSRKAPAQAFIIFENNHPQKLVRLEVLERQLSYLGSEAVMSAQNFDDTRYPRRRQMAFTTFDGLIYNLELYADNQDYWAKLTLSATPLPTTETNDYIRNSAFLYDGWFFKLSAETGRTLFQYKL
jgi:hypothetical protein